MRLKTAVALLACSQLAGCFFIFIPGSLVQKAGDAITGSKGEHCVTRAAKVGDRIRVGDKVFRVESLSGTSSRCVDPGLPIRAELALLSANLIPDPVPPLAPSDGGPGEEKRK